MSPPILQPLIGTRRSRPNMTTPQDVVCEAESSDTKTDTNKKRTQADRHESLLALLSDEGIEPSTYRLVRLLTMGIVCPLSSFLMRISPDFSLEVLKEMAPVKNQAQLEGFLRPCANGAEMIEGSQLK